MIFIAFPGAVATKRFEKGILALVSMAFFASCTATPIDHSPAADSDSRLPGHGYWRAENNPGLIIGIEGDQLIVSRAGSISEVSTILETSENGPRLCRFGQESFQLLERVGEALLSARLTDLESGNVLAAPSVKVPANEQASAESTLPGGSVSFTGKVDSSLHTATYTVRVTRGGKVVSEHSASVAVQ